MENTFLNKLLDFYNLTEAEYQELIKDVSIDNFCEGHHFEGIEKAAEIIKEAIKNNDKIIIYGDYDCDGMLGTSILVKMFLYLNYDAKYYIPTRYVDGYGLTVENASKIKEIYDLIICVDNGIVANEAIDILKKANKKVIVIDHHTPQLPLPNADAFVHPEVSHFGDITTSAGFCAFMFSYYVLGYYDKYLSTLGAISIISDMMPLKGYNRNLLRVIFKHYKVDEFLQITLLSDSKQLDEGVVASLIAPRINAIGRLVDDKNINLIVKFFISDDKEYILTYFNHMLELNEHRKIIQKEASEKLTESLGENAIVSLVDVKEGIIGLIANSIVNKLKKPAVVFTYAKDNLLKGSARSVAGFNIVEAFQKLSDLLEGFGGHALAGGCSIKEENLDLFRQKFIELVNNTPLEKVEKKYIPISINDVSLANYNIYQTFAPFGIEWNAPLLRLDHIKISELRYSKTHDHIITQIGNNTKITGWGMGNDDFSNHTYMNAYGQLTTSSFRGITSIDFKITSYELE